MCFVISFTVVLLFDSLQILNVKFSYNELAPSKSISTPHFIVNVLLFLSVVTTNCYKTWLLGDSRHFPFIALKCCELVLSSNNRWEN